MLFVSVKINNQNSQVGGCPMGLTLPKAERCPEEVPRCLGVGAGRASQAPGLVSGRSASGPTSEPQILSGG